MASTPGRDRSGGRPAAAFIGRRWRASGRAPEFLHLFPPRFDSVILVAPVVFHYLDYFVGVGADQAPRILTGV